MNPTFPDNSTHTCVSCFADCCGDGNGLVHTSGGQTHWFDGLMKGNVPVTGILYHSHFAPGLGWAVFPCEDKRKRSMLPEGVLQMGHWKNGKYERCFTFDELAAHVAKF